MTENTETTGLDEITPEQQKKIQDALGKMSRRDWRAAVEALGVPRTEMDDLDLTIVMAKQLMPEKEYAYFDTMALDELQQEILKVL